MHWLRGLVVTLVCGSVMSACSSQDSEVREAESLGQVSQAITAACNLNTIGLPCDPDGPAGTKLECEGVCGIARSGLVACQAVTTGTLDGVICGTLSGIGDNACKRYCSGKTCLSANAPQGAACRPNSKSTPCEGQCDGAGKCDNLGGSACSFGRDAQLCTFATCDFAKATECLSTNLGTSTLCSDDDACAIGHCTSVGVCKPSGTVGCDDGNSCTDDTCDPEDGGCSGTPNDSNSCSDFNACLTGEHCSNGNCVAGTEAVECDDGNACTADSCDPNTGCAHVKKSCSDGDACTADSCDTATGDCSNEPVACSDGDACTVDSCNSASGCVFTAMNCDDGNACTTDSCSAGSCGHAGVACNDNDACTTDSCDIAQGCGYTPIPGCGVVGSGGEGGGAGMPGAAGEAPVGEGGESTGGTPNGAAGAGEAGSPEPEGGNGGSGEPPVGGSGGTSGSGNAQGGNAQPSAGTETGGTSTTAGTANQGGGGTSTDGQSSGESSGCGCRSAGAPADRAPLSGLLLAALGLALVRRRRAA